MLGFSRATRETKEAIRNSEWIKATKPELASIEIADMEKEIGILAATEQPQIDSYNAIDSLVAEAKRPMNTEQLASFSAKIDKLANATYMPNTPVKRFLIALKEVKQERPGLDPFSEVGLIALISLLNLVKSFCSLNC
jgi:hypothetical protein